MQIDNHAPPPSPSSYHSLLSAWIAAHAKDHGFSAALATVKDALQILWHLDLQPAEEILHGCYAPSPRGGNPHLPTALLRSLFLAHLLGHPNIHDWVDQLSRSPLLCALSGFFDRKRPGVGTFYDFFHRLHDGYVAPGLRERTPSEIQRARAKEARPVPPTPPIPPGEEAPDPKSEKKSEEGEKAEEAKIRFPMVYREGHGESRATPQPGPPCGSGPAPD